MLPATLWIWVVTGFIYLVILWEFMLRKSKEYNEFFPKQLNIGYPVGDPKSPEPKEVPSSFLYLLKGHVSYIIKPHRVQIKSSANWQKFNIKNFQKNWIFGPQCTVRTFHTKGWTKFFSVQISTFWGQNNVFYDSVRPQSIFW